MKKHLTHPQAERLISNVPRVGPEPTSDTVVHLQSIIRSDTNKRMHMRNVAVLHDMSATTAIGRRVILILVADGSRLSRRQVDFIKEANV